MTSCTSVDFPEPETPVIATIKFKGNSMSMPFKLFARHPMKDAGCFALNLRLAER